MTNRHWSGGRRACEKEGELHDHVLNQKLIVTMYSMSHYQKVHRKMCSRTRYTNQACIVKFESLRKHLLFMTCGYVRLHFLTLTLANSQVLLRQGMDVCVSRYLRLWLIACRKDSVSLPWDELPMVSAKSATIRARQFTLGQKASTDHSLHMHRCAHAVQCYSTCMDVNY